MAEALLINRLPSGYDEDFVNAVEDEIICLICHLPLKEPVLTRCGHRFCKECLDEHFRRREVDGQPLTCPADRERLNRRMDVFPDKATERKILSFAIRCPSEGCDWTGELRSKEIHLKSCLFKLVSCTNQNCHETSRRKDLEQHVTITCQWRIIKCEHCSESHPHCQMQDHSSQCSKFPVPCPNKCGRSIPRELIPNHTAKDCPLTVISCPFVEIGCKIKVQRKEVESHLKSDVKPHLDLARVKLKDTEAKLNNTEVKLNITEARLNNTEVKLNNTEAKLNNTEAKLNNTEVKLNNTEAKLNITEAKLNDTEAKLNETQEKLDTRMFIWKIDNFSEILRQAKTGKKLEIFSSPFYTGRSENYGYKLKVKVYPNGVTSTKNTHLSVFICGMKGKYDAILPWPFKKKLTFTLIDQQEDPVEREDVTHQLAYNPGNINIPQCYARPTNNDDNPGFGFLDFISHEKLHSRRYIVDDALFLQVEA